MRARSGGGASTQSSPASHAGSSCLKMGVRPMFIKPSLSMRIMMRPCSRNCPAVGLRRVSLMYLRRPPAFFMMVLSMSFTASMRFFALRG